MRWIAISGSWRFESSELDKDLSHAIDKIIKNGDGIVSGGALGVDYKATAKMMAANNWQKRIKIIIPTSLEIYKDHYYKRADEGVITKQQATDLIDQLVAIKTAGCLTELKYHKPEKRTYYARNREIIKSADELWAFQINDSLGVQDAVSHAREFGTKVKIWEYQV